MYRYLLAIASGIVFACAFPEYDIGWLAFVALLPLIVAVVRTRRTREAFLLGWIAQTVAWLMMVPWVVRVMSHYGGLPYLTGVLIFIALSAILGIYGGAFAAIVHRLRLGDAFAPWLLVPLAWALVEFARTHLLTGFPWNLIAASMIDYAALVQFDRVAGPYLLGAMVVLPATVVAWSITQKTSAGPRVVVVGATGIFLLVWWGTGLMASKLFVRPTGGPQHVAALLQPNISQEMRWDESSVIDIFRKMEAMTRQAAASGAKVIVWPESTVPLAFARTPFYTKAIEGISREFGVDVILGSVADDPGDQARLWNSAFLVTGGKTSGRYDKIRLVPFGEYVPLRKMLFFAQKLVRAVGEFQFGTNTRPLSGAFRYGPAICYEIVFPQITRNQVSNGANVLVTVTNDAWYDGTSAPRQHLNQARLRAIEGDRYLLRAGTTGISALIDPTGRILQQMPMGREGIIYARFETRDSVTPYVRFGDWFAWLSLVAVSAMLWRRNAVRFGRR